MGLFSRVFWMVVTVPFVVGLYVVGTKPALISEVFTAYETSGVLGTVSVLAGAPDVLAVIGLTVLIVLIDPEPLDR